MTYSGSCDDCTGDLVLMMKEGDNNYGCVGPLNDVENKIVLMAYNDEKGCSLYFKVQLPMTIRLCAFCGLYFRLKMLLMAVLRL